MAAVEAAAATLGLRPDQVEVEVLKQPVPSTFGKIGEAAVVRVTQRTAAPEPIESTVAVGAQPVAAVVGGDAEQSTPTAVDRPASRGSAGRRHPEVTDPDAVAADTELAGDFVEGLLDALDVDGDITTWVDVAGGPAWRSSARPSGGCESPSTSMDSKPDVARRSPRSREGPPSASPRADRMRSSSR